MIKFDSEKSLENFIKKYFDENEISIINGENYDSCHQQFDTKGYGICDLVFIGCDMEFVNDEPVEFPVVNIVELKNEQIKIQDFAQIARYRTFFERAFSFNGIDRFEIKCSLVVPESINLNSDCCYMTNASAGWLDVYEFILNPMEGIDFNLNQGYHKTSEDLTSIGCLVDIKDSK